MRCELGRRVAGADVQGYDGGFQVAMCRRFCQKSSRSNLGRDTANSKQTNKQTNKTHSTKLVRAAGLSAPMAVSSSSSPGASSAPVSPTSRARALSPPSISTSPDSSATPPKMRTSGSAICSRASAQKTAIFSFFQPCNVVRMEKSRLN